jgi:predicted ATP-grasp superfamily ATP-dependent carboligase
MDHVSWRERTPLERPALVCAFRGWNDGGEAATLAAKYLIERWHARPIASIDPEEFLDFQVSRPTVRLEDGVSRVIEWPACEFFAATVGGRSVVVLVAPEPNVRWRAFTAAVLGAAREVGSPLLVTLGAFLTDVPHSRAVPVVGSAEDEATADKLGLARSQYEGPTGIVGVLHDASNRSGLPSVSLWAAVPHYLPAAPNPKAALALVERTAALLGVPVETGPLAEAAAEWEQGVSRLVRESEDLGEYVERLENAAEEAERQRAEGGVPSGEAIAAELERFLREHEEGPGGGV